MQPILLAGFPLGSSLGLVVALEWLGQPYRLTRIEMPDDMLSDAYGRLNGRRETPVLVTEDGALTETMAIALWLETASGASASTPVAAAPTGSINTWAS